MYLKSCEDDALGAKARGRVPQSSPLSSAS